jgi:hypothetical protein
MDKKMNATGLQNHPTIWVISCKFHAMSLSKVSEKGE